MVWCVLGIPCGFEGANPLFQGPVAQLVRAPPCHGGGREFESHLGRLESMGRFIFLLAS